MFRERERQREDSTKRALRHRGEKSGTTQDSETPTTRDSPFYCIHHHFIFLLLSICFISSWVLLQINSLLLRHFTPSAQRKKNQRGEFFFLLPGLQPSSTRFIPLGHNQTHLQLEAFSRAGWSDRHRGILCLLWPIKVFFMHFDCI